MVFLKSGQEYSLLFPTWKPEALESEEMMVGDQCPRAGLKP